MASGRKNYFRHSFFARNDEFVCELIDEFGLQGYFYYFALIEMCGEQSAENIPESYKYHKRTLVHSLRLNTRKLNLFLGYLQDKFKITYTYSENVYEIIFPNIAKYLGKYSTKIEPNGSNKRKEKEKKVKQTKKSNGVGDFDFEALYKNYPRKEGKSAGLRKCKSKIKTQSDYENLSQAIDNYSETCRVNDTGRRFIKLFSSFMTDWEDWLHVEKPPSLADLFPDPGVTFSSLDEQVECWMNNN